MFLPEPLDKLTPDDAQLFSSLATAVRYSAGECIFKEGTPGDRFYLLDQGQVRIELERSEIDSDAVLGYLDSNHVLGEIALLDGRPRSASAYAHTNVELREVAAEALNGLLDEHPRLYGIVFAALGGSAALKLRRTNDMLADAIFEKSDAAVDEVVKRAVEAQKQVADWPEDRIDAMLSDIAEATARHSVEFAEATVKETRIGNAEDKTLKNLMASVGVYQWLAGQTAAGPTREDVTNKVTELVRPVGVVLGLIPMTNPVATAVFKIVTCLKARNALILSFHRSSKHVGAQVGEMIQGVLKEHGAPVDLVQWIKDRQSRKTTESFMRHPGVAFILATGGTTMVQAAYQSGTPAIGVGPGNAPTLICPDANIDHAADCVVTSKSFDNGLICGSEQNLVVCRAVLPRFVESLIQRRAAVLTEQEVPGFKEKVTTGQGSHINPLVIGQGADVIARTTGIKREYPIKLLVVPTEKIDAQNPFALEKMAPVISLFVVDDEDQGIKVGKKLLQLEGAGHTAVIHTENRELIERFAAAMPASRVLVNTPASHGVIGSTTGLIPSLTLGCGTLGNNSTSDNVNFKHLLNTTRIAEYLPERMLQFMPLLKYIRK